MKNEYECKVLEINLKTPVAYQVGTNILTIYDEFTRIPVLSKYILYSHDLGTTFTNLVNNLQFVDLLYLFNSELNNLNNCGIRLKIIDDGKSKYITYNDLKLFIFNEDGKITIIKNPKFADRHILWPISETNIDTNINYTYKSDILLFSSQANIEDNNNLYTEILSVFNDYPIKNLDNAIQNSRDIYEHDMVIDKKPFNIKGFSDDGKNYKLKIWINHYYDIDGNIIMNYLNNIFEDIYKTFSTRIDNINYNDIPFENKLMYSGITDHKNNYYLKIVSEKIDKKIADSIQSINKSPGINGIYLTSENVELQTHDKFIEFFKKEIDIIKSEITNHFKSLPYNYK